MFKNRGYWFGVALYTVGYACFSLSSFLSWFETDTGLESKALAIAASALFTGGSVVLLYYATPPWGTKT